MKTPVLPANTERAHEFDVANFVPAKSLLPDGSVVFGIPILPVVMQVLIDENSATVTYVGKSAPGAGETEALWLIMKINETTNPAKISFASGSDAFDKQWSNRANYVY